MYAVGIAAIGAYSWIASTFRMTSGPYVSLGSIALNVTPSHAKAEMKQLSQWSEDHTRWIQTYLQQWIANLKDTTETPQPSLLRKEIAQSILRDISSVQQIEQHRVAVDKSYASQWLPYVAKPDHTKSIEKSSQLYARIQEHWQLFSEMSQLKES